MRHSTLVELAKQHGVSLPPALTEEWPPELSTADERGWFRFQRLYDTARSVLRSPDDLRRLILEIAEDERAEGSGWLELQADPSGFAARYGGVTAFTELLLEAVDKAARAADIGISVIIAANRIRHPMDAGRWPGWRRSTPARASPVSGSPTTSGAVPRRSSAPRSVSPSGPG